MGGYLELLNSDGTSYFLDSACICIRKIFEFIYFDFLNLTNFGKRFLHFLEADGWNG